MTAEKLFDLRQLEAFAAVISTGSVTGAAKLIGRSQPVVTRLIQDLESELNFELLTRHGRRVTPTQNGALFFREVERLLADASRTRQRARDLALQHTQSLEIAATSTMSASLVPRALGILKARHGLPNKVTVRNLGPEEVIQTVASRAADIGIASLPLDHPGLEVQWIAEAACICVLHKDDPLCTKSQIDLSDLADRPIVTLLNPYRVLGRIAAAIEQAHLKAPELIRTNTSASALAMVREGLGVAILEPVLATMQPAPDTVVRPLTVTIPYLWGIVTPTGVPETPIIPQFVAALIEAAQTDLPGFRVRDIRETETILKNIFDLATAEPRDGEDIA